MDKKATIGRIVHYLPHGQYKPLPAVVVDVSSNGLYCNLCVFGKYESYHIEANFSGELEPGYWTWPIVEPTGGHLQTGSQVATEKKSDSI